MNTFCCCNEIMNLTINAENGEIILICNSCGEKNIFNYENKVDMVFVLNEYLNSIKKNVMYFEDVEVDEVVKLIGVDSNGKKIIALTDVTKNNKNQIKKDLALIEQLKNKSLILGDDVPALNLPFEEEGLVCKDIFIEIIKNK